MLTLAPYRTRGRLIITAATRNETWAGGLLRILVVTERWQDGGCKNARTGETCHAHADCPCAQNAAWLQNASLRERLLGTMRAAEISAGRRFTYRDLLGHASLSV